MARNFDELLSQIHMGNQQNKNFLSDSDDKLEINSNTREIIVPETFSRNIAVTNDYNSNEVTFVVATEIDGHSIIDCNKKTIKWHNKSSNERGWSDLAFEEKDGKLELTWLVPPEATTAAGPLHFAICFCDVNDEGKIFYKWNSLVCTSLSIAQGLDTVAIQGAALTQIINIDLISRQLIFSNEFNKTIGYVGDSGANKITFRAKRFLNDLDLLQQNVIIKYINAEGVYGEDNSITKISCLEDLGGNEKDDLIEFEWYLPNLLLAAEGTIKIYVTFYITNQIEGTLYSWSTAPETRLTIGEGIRLSSFEPSEDDQGLKLVQQDTFEDLLLNYFT